MRIEQAMTAQNLNLRPEVGTNTEAAEQTTKTEHYFSVDARGICSTNVDKTGATGISSLDELQSDASAIDVDSLKEQMAVLSNTLTPEDYQKVQEEGYSAASDDIKTIVTVMDKIKMSLAEAGVDVSYYGDLPSDEKLQEMSGGSPAQAQRMASALAQADLPVTEDNLKDGLTALNEASGLTDLNDGQKKYFISSGEDLTIGSAYRSQYSFAGNGTAGGTELSDETLSQMQSQMENIAKEAGFSSEEGLPLATWLVQNDLPVTTENLQKLNELNQVSLPIDNEKAINAITTAVSEGKRPEDALLTGKSLKERALDAYDVIQNADESDVDQVIQSGKPLTIANLKQAMHETLVGEGSSSATAAKAAQSANKKAQSAQEDESLRDAKPLFEAGFTVSVSYTEIEITQVTARRQLEEARLTMSVQANFSLLKQGISIETEPMEDLIKDLKEIENQFYQNMMEQVGLDATDENMALVTDTQNMVEDLKTMPAAVLGTTTTQTVTMQTLYEAGVSMQLSMTEDGVTTTASAAIRSYETLMTAPRSDLGDSYSKAFQNVDTILTDLGLDTGEANERAVRILAYNETEITTASIAEMRMADSQVQNLLQNLTPSVTMHLIKEGINPLDTPVSELSNEITQIREENGYSENEDFAEYLWKLEHTDGIEESDREAYIGMYRLIRQVEKSDGAVVGSLVEQGADLTLNNLLTAVKTRQNKGIDVTVDNDFGRTEQVSFSASTIAAQLAKGFSGSARHELSPERLQGILQENQVEAADGEALLGSMTVDQAEAALSGQSSEGTQTTSSVTENAETIGNLDLAWAAEQTEEFSQALDTEDSVIRYLQQTGVTTSAENLVAAQQYFDHRNDMYRRIFGATFENEEEQINFEEIKQDIIERFAEAVKSPEEMAEAQEALADVAENALKNMLPPDDKVTSLDVRELRQTEIQLSLASKWSQNENYAIPVMVEGENATVHLQIVHGKREKGKVGIVLETETYGKLAAEIENLGDRMQGVFLTDRADAYQDLKTIADNLTEELNSDEKEVQLQVAVEKNLNLTAFELDRTNISALAQQSAENESEETAEDEDSTISTNELYSIAKTVIGEIIRVGRTHTA